MIPMKRIRHSLSIAAVIATLGGPLSAHGQFLTKLSNFSANLGNGTSGGEIPAFDPFTDRLFVTSSNTTRHQINVFDLSIPSAPSGITTINFTNATGSGNLFGLSSVAIDPTGRGFGVAALIPTNRTTTVGLLGFFNTATGAIIGNLSISAGFHPDSLTFSADGTRLVVVNEGEFVAGLTNTAGSISILDISSINSGNLGNLTGLSASTFDFSSGNRAAGVTLDGLRNPSVGALGTSGNFIQTVPNFTALAGSDPDFFKGMEPEYASISGNKITVTLQEANALAIFDLNTNKWEEIHNLGTINQIVDGGDFDLPPGGNGSAKLIDDTVAGLPMPDTVATFTIGNKTYAVTANEGDVRTDDRDGSRLGDTAGNDTMNGTILDPSIQNNAALRGNLTIGRLNVSRIDGDTDGDGDIDVPTMFGTRSLSIWDIETGALVSDTGSLFEQTILSLDTAGYADGRSDDKGPEPEGLTLGTIDGRRYAFVGMERNNAIMMIDITDPEDIFLVDYNRVTDVGAVPLRPEGMQFVSAADSPNGQNLLIVGFEGDGAVVGERIVVFSVIPEPSTALLILIGGGVAALRRRRQP